jgi:hypothetical protein
VAEAQLLRAFYYSVLVAQFGPVPLILTDDPVKNLSPKRDSVSKVYAQIVSDLRFAFQNLPLTPYENNPQRLTKKAAFGLLARVYAQGGGEGLSEGGKSYWLRAKEVADSLSTTRQHTVPVCTTIFRKCLLPLTIGIMSRLYLRLMD